MATWSIAVFVTLPFFKNERKKKCRDVVSGLVSFAYTVHTSTYQPPFLASSNPAPFAYYVPFFYRYENEGWYSL
jgi:hypothetical protein